MGARRVYLKTEVAAFASSFVVKARWESQIQEQNTRGANERLDGDFLVCEGAYRRIERGS